MAANAAAYGPAPAGSPISWRNNNPGNLRGQYFGATGSAGGFATYATPQAGWDAMEQQLTRYYEGKTTGRPLQTINDIISTYAPASENNVSSYANVVAKKLGVGIHDQLDWNDPTVRQQLMSAMATHEAGRATPYGSTLGREEIVAPATAPSEPVAIQPAVAPAAPPEVTPAVAPAAPVAVQPAVAPAAPVAATGRWESFNGKDVQDWAPDPDDLSYHGLPDDVWTWKRDQDPNNPANRNKPPATPDVVMDMSTPKSTDARVDGAVAININVAKDGKPVSETFRSLSFGEPRVPGSGGTLPKNNRVEWSHTV
jgi:hypothetical protein